MDEKEFRKDINISNALKKSNISIILILVSMVTYIRALIIYLTFDFGMIFEILSLIALIISRIYMKNNDEKNSKKFIIIAAGLIIWLIIYDIVFLLYTIKTFMDIALFEWTFLFDELILIGYLISLYEIYKKLSKISNPEKFKESTDWFYEKAPQNNENEIKK